jgi:hypothetical protein
MHDLQLRSIFVMLCNPEIERLASKAVQVISDPNINKPAREMYTQD